MTNYLKAVVILIIFLGISVSLDASDFTWFNIATFSKQDNKTDLGGDIVIWNSNLKDKSQKCVFEYGDNILKITYDVDSATGSASNGIKIDLGALDLTKEHHNLVLLIKGDEKIGFTTRLKVKLEAKDGKNATQIAEDITSGWKQIYLPFSMFKGDVDWKKIKYLYIIFDSSIVTQKEGVLYIDTIFLSF